MKYECKLCSFETDYSSNWCAHKKTNKHVKNEQKTNKCSKKLRNTPKILHQGEFTCKDCGRFFTTKYNLNRHVKSCSNEEINKLLEEKDREIERLKNENIIKELMHKIENYENEKSKDQKIINILEKNNEEKQKVIEGTHVMLKTSVNALSYVITNYKDAPVLEPLIDYSQIEEKNKFINCVVYNKNEAKLREYLGNFIVIYYKKQDCSQQSLWNSDTVRLTYVIRECVNTNASWIVDKKGVKMAKQVIDGLLVYVKKILQEHMITLNKKLNDDEDETDKTNYLKRMNTCNEIINDINTGNLKDDINKYIAPHFYLNK